TYEFEAAGAATAIALRDAVGGFVADGQPALLTYTPQVTATYYLDAYSDLSLVGPYTVTAAVAPDDYPADTSTTGVVSVGGSTPGRVDAPGDHDWFRVVLTA